MAAPKFPLKMGDGSEVRTLEELREHADLFTLVTRYQDGSLQRWLKLWGFQEETTQVEKLDGTEENFHQTLCEALGVDWSEKLETAYQEATSIKEAAEEEEESEVAPGMERSEEETKDEPPFVPTYSTDSLEELADKLMTRQIDGVPPHIPTHIIETKNFCVAMGGNELINFGNFIIDKRTQSIDADLTKKYEKYLQYITCSMEFEEDAVLVVESDRNIFNPLSRFSWEIKVGILNLASGEYRQLPIPKEKCKIITVRGHYMLFSQGRSIYLYDFLSGKKKEIPGPDNCEFSGDVGDIAADTLYLLAKEAWTDQLILFKVDLDSNMMLQKVCTAYTIKNGDPRPDEIKVVGSSLWIYAKTAVQHIDHLYRIDLQSLQSYRSEEFYGERAESLFFNDYFIFARESDGELWIMNLADGKVSLVAKDAYYLGIHKLWNWLYYNKKKGYDGVDFEHIYKINLDQPNDIEMLDVRN